MRLQKLMDETDRTCFFVLGLISSTIQGAEILSDFGWDATLSPLGLPLGICVPADVSKFTMVSVLRD
jgi:rapamycin-insensitive companion of mTOR